MLKPNVSVFGFDHYEPIVADMAYYKDAGHFVAGINRWMLERMVDDDSRFRLTPENVVPLGEAIWQKSVARKPYSSCMKHLESCGGFDPARH